MENRNIAGELAEILPTGYEWNELEEFTQQLTDAEKRQYKVELVEAHLSVFSLWCYDWMCDKIQTDDAEGFIEDLLGLLNAIEQLDADHPPYTQRAECYKLLADLPNDTEQKLSYLNQAIDQYRQGVQHGDSTLHAAWASVVLDQMELRQQFQDLELTEVLRHFQQAMPAFSESVLSSWMYASFRILEFSFAKNHSWHVRFFQALTDALLAFTNSEPFIHLLWVQQLLRILDHNAIPVPSGYQQVLYQQLVDELKFVVDYQSDDTEKLNQLGHAFDKVAKSLPDSVRQLEHYKLAIKFFTQGQSLNPAAWTFPVYATNAIKAMAQIYHAQGNQAQVIDWFEQGRSIFAKNTYPEFTLSLYWGDFLIEYARLGYDFHAPEIILQEAEEKLLVAKEFGENYYSHPFLSLAKVALKQGDKSKCLTILQECHQALGQYMEWASVLKDEDFAGITADEILDDSLEK